MAEKDEVRIKNAKYGIIWRIKPEPPFPRTVCGRVRQNKRESYFMPSIGTGEMVVILVVILLLFGAKRIPEIARALGKASHEFKKAKDEIKKEGESLLDESEKAAEKEEKK